MQLPGTKRAIGWYIACGALVGVSFGLFYLPTLRRSFHESQSIGGAPLPICLIEVEGGSIQSGVGDRGIHLTLSCPMSSDLLRDFVSGLRLRSLSSGKVTGPRVSVLSFNPPSLSVDLDEEASRDGWQELIATSPLPFGELRLNDPVDNFDHSVLAVVSAPSDSRIARVLTVKNRSRAAIRIEFSEPVDVAAVSSMSISSTHGRCRLPVPGQDYDVPKTSALEFECDPEVLGSFRLTQEYAATGLVFGGERGLEISRAISDNELGKRTAYVLGRNLKAPAGSEE